MKKYFLGLSQVVLLIFISNAAFPQVCEVGSDTSKLFTPDTLQTVFVGQPYEQVITVHVPKDTTITLVGVKVLVYIDSVHLDSVTGLPANFSYACNPSSCTIKGNTNGCLALSGLADASQVGNYILNGSILGYLFDGISFHFTYTIPVDSLYILKVRMPTGISGPSQETFTVSDPFPNPAKNSLHIIFSAKQPEDMDYTISDLSGRKILAGHRHESSLQHTMSFDISKLISGQYLIQFNTSEGSVTRTFFKQ